MNVLEMKKIPSLRQKISQQRDRIHRMHNREPNEVSELKNTTLINSSMDGLNRRMGGTGKNN